MKNIGTAILFICLFYVSPLCADYSRMNTELKNYTPPVYYTDALTFKAGHAESAARPDDSSGEAFLQIENLKKGHENNISHDHEIFFLQDNDKKTFKRLADISSDSEAVRKLVSHTLRLQEIEIIAGLRNPAILAAQKKVKAELESFDQVLDLDNTLKQYSTFTEGLDNKVGPAVEMKESIKQKYPYPGLTALKGRIIDQQVAVFVEKMRIAQRDTITETRQAYWNIVFIEQSIKVTAETIDALARLKDVATTLYRSGRTSFQDIIKINIKMELLKENLVTLSSKKKNIEGMLSELLNLPANTRMGAVIISKPDKNIPGPEVLFSLARQNRQELKVIQHQISKVENMVEMTESMILEPFTLGLSSYENEAVNTIGTGAEKPSFPEKTMAAMKNSSPLKPWYGIDDPWLNQTKLTLAGLRQTLIKQENATDRMVRDVWFLVDQNKRELALYKNTILSLAKSALDVSTREYESGSIPFSQAIESYTAWLKTNLTIAEKKTGLGSATANLERTIGQSFRQ